MSKLCAANKFLFASRCIDNRFRMESLTSELGIKSNRAKRFPPLISSGLCLTAPPSAHHHSDAGGNPPGYLEQEVGRVLCQEGVQVHLHLIQQVSVGELPHVRVVAVPLGHQRGELDGQVL